MDLESVTAFLNNLLILVLTLNIQIFTPRKYKCAGSVRQQLHKSPPFAHCFTKLRSLILFLYDLAN